MSLKWCCHGNKDAVFLIFILMLVEKYNKYNAFRFPVAKDDVCSNAGFFCF